MKTWLIKLGKAWAVLKQDGFLRGGKRILNSLERSFQPIASGDILFISGGTGDSARYRTQHVAEELSLQGFRVDTTVQDNPGLLTAAERFRIFVFHRTLVTASLTRFLDQLKVLNKTVLFETDDLVYDPNFLIHMDYYQKMNALEKKQYEHGVGGEIVTDPYVAVATTTTRFLADKLREKGKQVFIVPNRLSQEDLLWAEGALKDQGASRKNQKEIRIGYFSGTPSHDKDFGTVTEALEQLFEQYPNMQLVLAGPLQIEERLKKYMNRIKRLPFVSRDRLFANIATLDINLAPLEIGNPFCESKSELKFFEAGIVGVPTVAAATQTFREAIHDGVDGFVAARTEEWVDKIGELIKNKDRRVAMGQQAQTTTLARYTTKGATNTEYYNYLRSKL